MMTEIEWGRRESRDELRQLALERAEQEAYDLTLLAIVKRFPALEDEADNLRFAVAQLMLEEGKE